MNEETDSDETEDLDDEEDFDCYMTASGQCGAAGSEWCDFECPFRDTVYAQHFSRARRRR